MGSIDRVATKSRWVVGIAGLIGATCVLPAASAFQAELYLVSGNATRSNFGGALAAAGDVDLDGRPDLLIGASDDWAYTTYYGSASLRSGVDGSMLFEWWGSAGDHLGSAVAPAGDVDGDGFLDLLVGAIGAVEPATGLATGAVHVYSGADGSLLRSMYGDEDGEQFGAAIANVGDVDGDGLGDWWIGAPASDHGKADSGSVYLRSAADGGRLARVDGAAAGDGLGSTVIAIGDGDQDGIPDFAAGAPFADPGAIDEAGEVIVFSGATLQPRFQFDGVGGQHWLGRKLAGGADLDGDGVPDLILGVSRYVGVVRAISGSDGSVLWNAVGSVWMGEAVAMADTDGDGRAELLATDGFDPEVDTFVHVLSPSGVVLYTWVEQARDARLGDTLEVLGDVDNDGIPDYALASPYGDDGSDHWAGTVSIRSGSRFWLNAMPKRVDSTMVLSTRVRTGTPAQPVLRFVVEVSGTRFVNALLPITTFDGAGSADFTDSVPAGLSGLSVTLRAYAVGARSRIEVTNDELVELL